MSESWIAERGDFAVFASLMIGGYLLAAVALAYVPGGTRQREAGRLALSVAIVLAVLFPVLSPLTTVIGVAAAVAAWLISCALSGVRMAAAHLLIVAVAGTLAGLQPADSIWSTYWQDARDSIARIGVFAAAYALVSAPGGYAVAWLMHRPNLRFQRAGAEVEIAGRGRVIGVLERLIILTLGLSAQWQAIGLVVAAKSIARFRNLEERDFAEYYLIGTLASLLIALLVAAGARVIT